MKKIGFLGLCHIHTQSFAKALIKRKNIKVIGLWDSDINLSKKYSKFFKCNMIYAIIVSESYIHFIQEANGKCLFQSLNKTNRRIYGTT